MMYYLPDTGEKMIYILRIVYSKRNMDEIHKNWMFNYVSIGHKLIGALSYSQFAFEFKNQASHHWVNTLW